MLVLNEDFSVGRRIATLRFRSGAWTRKERRAPGNPAWRLLNAKLFGIEKLFSSPDVGVRKHVRTLAKTSINGAITKKPRLGKPRERPRLGLPKFFILSLHRVRHAGAGRQGGARHEIAHAHDSWGGSSWFRRHAPANSKRCANFGGKRGSTSKTQFQYFSTSLPSEGRILLIS